MYNGKFILEYTPIDWNGYYDRNLTAFYDPINDSISFNNSQYPEFMRKGKNYGISSWNYSRILSKNGEFIYSFNYDPTLYIKSDKGSIEVNAQIPDQFDKSKQPINDDVEIGELVTYFLQRTQYFDLYQDKTNSIFARVVYSGVSDDELETVTTWEDKSFHLQIFDKNFKYIGYQFFEGKKYSSSSMFFHDKMVYIPFHNKSNLETSEDKIILYKYEINM